MERGSDVSEANERILDMQLQVAEPLTATEKASTVVVTQGRPLSIPGIRERLSQP